LRQTPMGVEPTVVDDDDDDDFCVWLTGKNQSVTM